MEKIPTSVLAEILVIAGNYGQVLSLSLVCKRWKSIIEKANHFVTFQGSKSPREYPGNINVGSCMTNFYKNGWHIAYLDLKNVEITEEELASLIVLQPRLIKLDISNSFLNLSDTWNKIIKKLQSQGSPSDTCLNLKEIRFANNPITHMGYHDLVTLFPKLNKLYAGCTNTDWNDLRIVIWNLKMLEILDVSCCPNLLDQESKLSSEELDEMLTNSQIKTIFINTDSCIFLEALRNHRILIIDEIIYDLLCVFESGSNLEQLENFLNLGGDVNLNSDGKNNVVYPQIRFIAINSNESL